MCAHCSLSYTSVDQRPPCPFCSSHKHTQPLLPPNTQLGSGAYATVYECTNRVRDESVVAHPNQSVHAMALCICTHHAHTDRPSPRQHSPPTTHSDTSTEIAEPIQPYNIHPKLAPTPNRTEPTRCDVTDQATGVRAAVKVVDRTKLTPEDDAALKDEVAILRVLRHDHIVRIFDFYQVT